MPLARYLSLTTVILLAATCNISIFNLGSYLVSLSAYANDSVHGWLVPPDKGDNAQSMISTPASIALLYVISMIPPVQCACNSIGNLISFLSFVINSYASSGSNTPAMSLIHKLSAPIFSTSFASDT